jgi:hypothetical protein
MEIYFSFGAEDLILALPETLSTHWYAAAVIISAHFELGKNSNKHLKNFVF